MKTKANQNRKNIKKDSLCNYNCSLESVNMLTP